MTDNIEREAIHRLVRDQYDKYPYPAAQENLIDFINRAVRSGVDIKEAVIESGRARFRPVLLTSVTTVAGLFPLLLERSFQAQFLVPMAVSLGFGVLFATFVIMILVPALTMMQHDALGRFRARKERREAIRQAKPEVA